MSNKTVRNFPRHTLVEALAIPQKIQDEMAGKAFKRLLLADAVSLKPSSSNFRDLLSYSYKYGLTEGTEKATEISLTPTGAEATQTKGTSKRVTALRKAALTPSVFRDFLKAYTERKLPSPDMMKKLLISEFKIPSNYADECARIIVENCRYTNILRDIGGSPHILLDSNMHSSSSIDEHEFQSKIEDLNGERMETKTTPAVEADAVEKTPRPIFLGHGKNQAPLEKVRKILTSFQIPFKVVVDEANLGRPIPQKVRETIKQCGSAILIFTCDEKFHDAAGNVVWRPSENVVYELGAVSYEYEERVVIFKERGLYFPTNFQSVGYIEFEENSIEAKTTDLLKELIGFGLVKITTMQ